MKNLLPERCATRAGSLYSWLVIFVLFFARLRAPFRIISFVSPLRRRRVRGLFVPNAIGFFVCYAGRTMNEKQAVSRHSHAGVSSPESRLDKYYHRKITFTLQSRLRRRRIARPVRLTRVSSRDVHEIPSPRLSCAFSRCRRRKLWFNRLVFFFRARWMVNLYSKCLYWKHHCVSCAVYTLNK